MLPGLEAPADNSRSESLSDPGCLHIFFTREGLFPCACSISDYVRGFPIDERGIQLPAATDANQVELLAGGEAILPRLLELIAGSQPSIRFQVMLFHPDETGHAVADELAAASERGVAVQLSFDIDQTVKGAPFSPYSREIRRGRGRKMGDNSGGAIARFMEEGFKLGGQGEPSIFTVSQEFTVRPAP